MSLFVNPRQFQNDRKGRSAAGAQYEFYTSGTYNNKDVYSDPELTAVLPNPVIADNAGRFPKIYLAADTPYRVVYRQKLRPGVYETIWEEDGVYSPLSSLSGSSTIEAIEDLPPATGSGRKVDVVGYHTGTTVGGGSFVDSGLARHNGVTLFDPNRSPEIGTAAYYVDSGVDAACWERVGIDRVTAEMAGAIGDGISDDSLYLEKCWLYFIASNFSTFEFTSAQYYLGTKATNYTLPDGSDCYFSTDSNDGLNIVTNNAVFTCDQYGRTDSSIGVLFAVAGSKNTTLGSFRPHADAAQAGHEDGLDGLRITHKSLVGSKNVHVGDILGKALRSVVRIEGDSSDYATNGFDATSFSEGVRLGTVGSDNSDVAFDYVNSVGYGVEIVFSGKNVQIDSVVMPGGFHRALFTYGSRDVRINYIYGKNSNASFIRVGTYASVFNLTVENYLLEQVQNLPSEAVTVIAHELTQAFGGSIDLINGRPHICQNIKIHGKQIVSGTLGAAVQIGKSSATPADDSDIRFINIDTSVELDSVTASRAYIIFPEEYNYSNTTCDGLRISYCKSVGINSQIRMIPPCKLIEIERYEGANIYGTYGDLSTATVGEGHIHLKNSTLTGRLVSDTSFADAKWVIEDTELNTIVNSAHKVTPYNKTFIRSSLGGQYFEYKGPIDVYTAINDSSNLYAPDAPVDNLMGGELSSGADSNPRNVDLVAPSDYTTEFSPSIYHDWFRGSALVTKYNAIAVKLVVTNTSTSGYSIAYGKLAAYGVVGNDFTTGSIALTIDSVTNFGSMALVAGDFAFSVVDATTIRFTVNQLASELCVLLTKM